MSSVASLHLLSTEQGGRKKPVTGKFRPNHNFGSRQSPLFELGGQPPIGQNWACNVYDELGDNPDLERHYDALKEGERIYPNYFKSLISASQKVTVFCVMLAGNRTTNPAQPCLEYGNFLTGPALTFNEGR